MSQSRLMQMRVRQTVAPPAQADPFAMPRLAHPNDRELNTMLRKSTMELNDAYRPPNTAKQFDNRMLEYFDFCDKVYPHDPYRHTLASDKMHRFMWYQCFREKKTRGGSLAARTIGAKFNLAEYQNLLSQFPSTPGVMMDPAQHPAAVNPTGYSTFSIYKALFRKLYKLQVYENKLPPIWDQLWGMDMDDLKNHVKDRAPRIKKETYQEKVNGMFAPYTIVERCGEIEAKLWIDSACINNKRSINTNLRHRYSLLHLTSGILRCESLYRAELSDFLCVRPPRQEKDVHQPFVMVNAIAQGKTNHGRTLYGRATRHKDVALCCIGALAFYLSFRFYCTREFEDFTLDDWTDNEKWFDIKLLTDISGDNKTPMVNDSYGPHIRKVLNALSIICDKLLHLGRNLGGKILELLEAAQEEIRTMGQWNPSMFDQAYSSKLPMGPIRKLAGFNSNNGFYFNTRTVVAVPEELLYLTPMGKWCYKACEEVSEYSMNNEGVNPTAVETLKFFCELNTIFIQDAAALLAKYPDRIDHPLFRELPVFESEAFLTYKETMKRLLETEKSPLDANLEAVIPGMSQWQSTNHQAVQGLRESVESLSGEIRQGFQDACQNSKRERETSDQTLAAAFVNVAKELLSRKGLVENPFKKRIIEQEAASEEAHPNDPVIPTNATTNPNPCGQYRMVPKHTSLVGMWNEWHGLGEYEDQWGGIGGRNAAHGKRWRSHLPNQQYSRTSRIIEAIKKRSADTNTPIECCINEMDIVFKEKKGVLSNYVEELQLRGLIPKKASRGKTKKD